MTRLQRPYFYCLLCLFALFNTAYAANDSLLQNSINGGQRSEQNRARDAFRHPLETLSFFAVKPNATVIEMSPGKGWYTEILAPYLKQGGGQLIAAGFPLNDGPKWARKMQQRYQDYLASKPTFYDEVQFVEIGPPAYWSLGKPNSVDTVLTFRNVHNWVKGEFADKMFKAMFTVLKPGGILGITDHRANANTDLATMKRTGYMTEALVIELAEQAGFVLLAKSDINANTKDNKDHPKGVWTLPPTLRLGDVGRSHYLAIGESDRMTLKFKKPTQ